jgi:hypothetical protein
MPIFAHLFLEKKKEEEKKNARTWPTAAATATALVSLVILSFTNSR